MSKTSRRNVAYLCKMYFPQIKTFHKKDSATKKFSRTGKTVQDRNALMS